MKIENILLEKNKLSFSVKSNLIFTMKWWRKKVQMKRSVHAAVLSQGISYKLLAFSNTWDCNIKIFQSGNLKFLPQMGNRILTQQGGPHYEAAILNFLSMYMKLWVSISNECSRQPSDRTYCLCPTKTLRHCFLPTTKASGQHIWIGPVVVDKPDMIW